MQIFRLYTIMSHSIISHSTEKTRSVAKNLIEEIYSNNDTTTPKNYSQAQIICLAGDLGAGKTTFAQGILKTLDAQPPYTSPTFIIVKQYTITGHSHCHIVYHIDPYRINTPALIDLGWADMCADPHALIILEWPSVVVDIIPPNVTNIVLTSIDEQTRKITISDQVIKS